MKINIGVIFGGRTVEHDLSVLTAIQAMDYIDKEKYEVVPIYITKDLTWYAGGMLKYIDSFKDFRLIERYATKVNLVNKDGRFVLQTTGLFKHEFKEIHLVFPMVHGYNMEDGTIQGYLNLVGVPYVGADVYSSSVAQDKVFVREILEANGIDVVKYVWLTDTDYKNNKASYYQKIEHLKYPLLVKPARLGGSIGIEIINRKEELDISIERALKYDHKVLIEEIIEDTNEYNVAVLGSKTKMQVSDVEEIIKKEEICTYKDKFVLADDDDANIKRIVPANIKPDFENELKDLALKIFNLLNVRGTAKIEFLCDKKNKKIYFNEIDMVPNFYSHHLWENKNIDYKELMDILIKEEINNINERENMTFTIDENVFAPLTTKKIKEMK